ncbi:MAG: tetratricopeptide repeat protein, partial [Candidatus Hodarchaeota archaeon]
VDGEGTKQKEYLDKLLELFPSDKRVQHLAGQYFNFRERDFETALKYYQRVIELDKTYAPVYNSIGYLHLLLGNYKEAEKAFVEQIKLMSDRPNPYDSYAELLVRMGRYDESIEQYKKALNKDASFTSANAGIGDNYIFKGDYETARKYYENYFDNDPRVTAKFNALDKIAGSFILEENITKALEIYERYRTLAKEHNRVSSIVQSYINECLIMTESGNAAEGLHRYQKAAEVVNASDTPEAVKNEYGVLSRFWECYVLLANNETETALTKMKGLSPIVEKKQDPNDLRWMSFLNGMVESKKGNYTMAQEHYSSSWPDIPIIKYYVAVTYEKMGEKDKANELYQELEDRKQNNLALALVKHNIKKMTAR